MQIKIVPDLCIGCTVCAVVCPKGVLDVRSEVMAVVENPENCDACRKCEEECPERAIFITNTNVIMDVE